MEQNLLSVGIDIGTTTTQLVLSRLHVRNTAAAFTIPKLAITDREILHKSAIHFTPLHSDTVIDADAIREIVAGEYAKAGVTPGQIETGAVIITGETARKENARQVLSALSGFAGDFVVATAGPDLEGILAAKGAGCQAYAEAHKTAVLNFDIGGGTSNLCLLDAEGPRDTGCLNVGGRLLKLDPGGMVTYRSPVLEGRPGPLVGQRATEESLQPLLDDLVAALEEAAGLRPATERVRHYTTNKLVSLPDRPPVFSFSGGVADMIYADDPPPWLAFGDMGVLLGRAIRRSKLFAAPHMQPLETIRATVVGAGSHATTLSGSTIAYEGVEFPLKNLPVLSLSEEETAQPAEALADTAAKKLRWFWEDGAPEPVVLALRGLPNPSFQEICRLADGLVPALEPLRAAGHPVLLAVAEDMGKALGQAMACRMPAPRKLICLDGVALSTGAYLDIGRPVGSALPVVIKTLIFSS